MRGWRFLSILHPSSLSGSESNGVIIMYSVITLFYFLISSSLFSFTNSNKTALSVVTDTVGYIQHGHSDRGEIPSRISLLADACFQRGIHLRGNNTSNPFTEESLYPFGGVGQERYWQLAEWSSKFLIHQRDMVSRGEGKRFMNEGKILNFKKEGAGVLVRMDVKGSKEYVHPRRFGEPWVHLLLEQDFREKLLLSQMDSFHLLFEGRLIKSISYMTADSFDPGLHTAQFQLFLSVQNLNPLSDKYGDFLWFGVPFYDYRYEKISRYAAQDIGKGDATGKFIFSLSSEDYSQKSFRTKEWIKINTDLRPFLTEAIALAQKRGYLPGSNPEDMGVSGMNLGWEVPGTFDVGFEFKGFDLQVSRTKN